MAHKLAIVAFAGLTISAVCLGAAAALGGRHFEKNFDIGFLGDRPRCATVAGATATSRVIPWDGSDFVTVGGSARVHYSPAGDDALHVSGDPQTLAHLRVRRGSIEMDCRSSWRSDEAPLDITLPGLRFQKFAIAGSGQMVLEELDQPKVKLNIAGSGSIKASGKVDEVEVRIAGSGSADLARLDAKDAQVHIAGSGDADIAPREEAEIHIAGSGDVNLHSNPRKLETHIAGSGRIHKVSGSSV